MGALINKIWHALASVRLTFVCMLSMCVCAGWGYFLIRNHVNVFKPLHDTPLMEWARTWGYSHLSVTWWFFALMVLLAILSLNTFVCTTDRVLAIWKNRSKFGSAFALALRLSPHIMHYALIIILVGYLASYLFASTLTTVILLPDRKTAIENTDIKVTLTDLNIDYYEGERMSALEGRGLNATAQLEISRPDGGIETTQVGINSPARFMGLSAHLSSFAPRSKTGMTKREYVNLTIRRDPGILVYYAGMALFVLGLVLYVVSFTPVGVKQLRGSHA